MGLFLASWDAKVDSERPKRITAFDSSDGRVVSTVVCANRLAIGKGDEAASVFGKQPTEIGVMPIVVFSQIRLALCQV
jgi:hypothetical protein